MKRIRINIFVRTGLYKHNVHKYHKENRDSQSFDESKKPNNIKVIDDDGIGIGGMSTAFKQLFRGRKRASSSESVSVPTLTPSLSSQAIYFSKDDDYKLNDKYSYFAGASRGRNDSPKMLPHLFSLKSLNSFTTLHDESFHLIENHF